MTNLAAPIAEFVAGTQYADLPTTTRAAAGRVVMDAIGVMAAASGCSEDVQPFIDHAARMGEGGNCSVLGTSRRASAPLAALANGAMAHALDFEDVFDAAPCHPNASAVPAALALAQHLGNVSGERLVTAIAVGCDVACRVALGVGDALAQRSWYPPPIIGLLGAAAAVARLLDGTPDKVLDTMSVALLHATAPGAIGSSRQTTLRATREAFPASAAVTAGFLAASGSRGFEDPLCGAGAFLGVYAGGEYDSEAMLDGLGERYFIEDLSFKRWPTCRGTHGAIQAALDFADRDGFRWQDVERIDVTVSELQRMLAEPPERKRAPATLIDAKFSLPFSIAVALVCGRVSLAEFEPAVLTDPDVLAVSHKVAVGVRDDWEHAAAATLRVALSSGEVLERTITEPLGSLAVPLGDDDLAAKFVACVARAAQPPDRDKALDAASRLLALDRQDDVGALVDQLFPEMS